jgi:DNA-binding NarL/FixJ family response regulator
MVPTVGTVFQAKDVASAKSVLEEHRPPLVLLESGLYGGISSLLSWIKSEANGCRCLVLADDVRQQREAWAAGADAAVLKGFPAAKLLQVIERMLSHEGKRVSQEHTEPRLNGEVH